VLSWLKSVKNNFKMKSDSNIEILNAKQIDIMFETDNELVIYNIKKMTEIIGFKLMDQAMIATAASELTTNIIRYAKSGVIEINYIKNIENNKRGIEIIAVDKGPGIKDIDLAVKEKYTTTINSLGFGLASVNRIMDEFYIKSELEIGTIIRVRKWKKQDDICLKIF